MHNFVYSQNKFFRPIINNRKIIFTNQENGGNGISYKGYDFITLYKKIKKRNMYV